MASDDKADGAWFARTSYGARNRPVAWQGWLLMVLYVLAVIGAAFLIVYGTLALLAGLAAVTALFGYVVVRKSRLSARERLAGRN